MEAKVGADLSVYVDHAFAVGDWGRWSGGGHMQADTLGELHAFAARIGLRQEWFQSKPGRPENDHYDLTRAGRELAIELGATSEDRRSGTRRRQAVRLARRASPRAVVPRRVAVIASASGNGKTTFGRELAEKLGVRFVELDALVHGPDWVETPDDVLRAQVGPILASEGWVIDGTYQRKLGDVVLRSADVVVWLDLPVGVWLPRLGKRTWRRLRRHEELWNGNRESLSGAIWGVDSLFAYAVRSHFRRRREWPQALHNLPVVRLRTRAAVQRFLGEAGSDL